MKGRKFYVDLMQDSAEVTGSFTLAVVKIDNKTIKFAVDCGMYQEREYESQNLKFPVTPKDVDFVILTHNHIDHTGRLPMFVKKGFSGTIYTTIITKRILGRALKGSAKVLKDNSKRKNIAPLYTSNDVDDMFGLVEGYDYNSPIRINENITITFIPNGHIIGAASVLVQIHCPGEEKDINLFFSGDYNNRNMFYRVAQIRKWITKLPVNVIIESTYGNMESSAIKETFRKNIVKAVKEEKTIVIPVFSLGRAQEILYVLKDMQSKYPKLFEKVPIFNDGELLRYYTEMYYKFQEDGLLNFYVGKKDFLPENLTMVDSKQLRKEILIKKGCKIIVTSSGNGSYGPAQTYIPRFIKDPNALIHFTGYCHPDTLGYRLKTTKKDEIEEVSGTKVIKKADVEFTNEFSAHSKADELIKLLKKFEKLQFVLVNHGQDDVKDEFSNRILKELDLDQVGILGREYFYRIDKDGFVTSYTSKFI